MQEFDLAVGAILPAEREGRYRLFFDLSVLCESDKPIFLGYVPRGFIFRLFQTENYLVILSGCTSLA
jgi:hypothetical protein